MKTLQEIGLSFGTDKATFHGYCDFYEKYFEHIRNNEILMLEIGIFKGESIRMWKEYFEKGRIVSIDIDRSRLFEEDRVITEVCDQSNREALSRFNDQQFDIIIDDGGHTMIQQQVSFGVLFKTVKSGGFYSIEDLHTSMMPEYMNGLPYDMSTLFHLKEFERTGTFNFPHLTKEENAYLTYQTSEIEIFHRSDSSITSIIIKK